MDNQTNPNIENDLKHMKSEGGEYGFTLRVSTPLVVLVVATIVIFKIFIKKQ